MCWRKIVVPVLGLEAKGLIALLLLLGVVLSTGFLEATSGAKGLFALLLLLGVVLPTGFLEATSGAKGLFALSASVAPKGLFAGAPLFFRGLRVLRFKAEIEKQSIDLAQSSDADATLPDGGAFERADFGIVDERFSGSSILYDLESDQQRTCGFAVRVGVAFECDVE